MNDKYDFLKCKSTAFLLKLYRPTQHYCSNYDGVPYYVKSKCEFYNEKCESFKYSNKICDVRRVFNQETNKDVYISVCIIKEILDTRPHVLNKKESKLKRQLKIKMRK